MPRISICCKFNIPIFFLWKSWHFESSMDCHEYIGVMQSYFGDADFNKANHKDGIEYIEVMKPSNRVTLTFNKARHVNQCQISIYYKVNILVFFLLLENWHIERSTDRIEYIKVMQSSNWLKLTLIKQAV